MTDDNFVERVQAYSKWLLDLDDSTDSDSPSPSSIIRLKPRQHPGLDADR
jgi:hypothetical protein